MLSNAGTGLRLLQRASQAASADFTATLRGYATMRIRVMPLHILHAHMLHALQHARRALSGRGGHAQERDQLAASERVRTGSIVLVGAGRPRTAADAIADSRGATPGGNLFRYGRQADMNLYLQAHETFK